jgi:spermidine synthase
MILRQVIFESKPDQIQSEMQIVYRDPKKHEIPEHQFTTSVIAPSKKGKKTVLNYSFLTNEYQQAMLSGLYQANSLAEKKELNILNLGTGAGIMPMFLNCHMKERIKKITTIDINENMLKVAKAHFGFHTEGTNIDSYKVDAYEFINNASNKGEYDIIIMDVNYSDEDKSISPPWKFLETEFLQKVADLAASESSYLAFNVLYYNDASRKRVMKNF